MVLEQKISFKTKQHIYFAISGLVLLVVAIIMFLSYFSRNITNISPFVLFSVRHHMIIMFLMILAAVAFGFIWANMSYREIKKTRAESHSVLDIVFLFLGEDEKLILDFLVKHGGSTTQAEISRLEGMSRVRAFRSLKKLADKHLVDVVPHGKIRHVSLKPEIHRLLVD